MRCNSLVESPKNELAKRRADVENEFSTDLTGYRTNDFVDVLAVFE